MYYIKIKTRFNEIKLIIDDFYDERIQSLIQQSYVEGVYLRYINELEYKRNPEYNKVKRLERQVNKLKEK